MINLVLKDLILKSLTPSVNGLLKLAWPFNWQEGKNGETYLDHNRWSLWFLRFQGAPLSTFLTNNSKDRELVTKRCNAQLQYGF
jgi:hypothetical protein